MDDTHDRDEDRMLVEQVLAAPEGDTRAFEALVKRHTRGVVANCRYITRSSADSEDLAQDVFMKVYFALPRFERRSKFKTWLQRIKVNHCLNHLKKAEKRSFVELDETEGKLPETMQVAPEAARNIEHHDKRAPIERVLDSMNDTLRIPLIMCDMDELPYQEIAETLGIGLSAVKMRIKRARAEFRERYDRLRPNPAGESRT